MRNRRRFKGKKKVNKKSIITSLIISICLTLIMTINISSDGAILSLYQGILINRNDYSMQDSVAVNRIGKEHLELDSYSRFGSEKANKSKEQPTQKPSTKPDDAGPIYEKLYTYNAGGSILQNAGAGLIKNAAGMDVNQVNGIISQHPSIKIDLNSEKPQVLIMHTHTTESFERFDLGYYNPEIATRSQDEGINVVAIGQAIKTQLENNGINTIQDKTVNDLEYSGAYKRSREAVQNYLQKYPSIKIVLDIHRDAIQTADGARYKPTAVINGKKAAQIMLVSGTTGKGVELPNYQENLKFASRFQNQMESMYKNLTRPILFDFRHYNQDLTTGSLLIEVGSQANTISEVVYSGELIGKALAEYLKTTVN